MLLTLLLVLNLTLLLLPDLLLLATLFDLLPLGLLALLIDLTLLILPDLLLLRPALLVLLLGLLTTLHRSGLFALLHGRLLFCFFLAFVASARTLGICVYVQPDKQKCYDAR